jgi:hypothetical protein
LGGLYNVASPFRACETKHGGGWLFETRKRHVFGEFDFQLGFAGVPLRHLAPVWVEHLRPDHDACLRFLHYGPPLVQDTFESSGVPLQVVLVS